MQTTDPVLSLLNELCRVRGYRVDKGGPGERAIAERVADELRKYPWLTVSVEEVQDERGVACPGFYNVLAFDGDPSEVDLLVVGHLDTVTPSPGWTKPEYVVEDGRYYALGAIDTRGGIAAAIDAIGNVGPTKRVGYLFYGDEEVGFLGMQEFVRRHPEIAPKFGLSVCGGGAEAYLGWRGCVEMEFLFEGISGHASRPWSGANAAEALACVMEAVRLACVRNATPMGTAANVAAVHVGSLDATAMPEGFDLSRDCPLGKQQAPSVLNVANKIPNAGWALLDVRPGGEAVSAAFIERVAREALAGWNADRKHAVTLTIHVNFEMPAYLADRERIDWLFKLFNPVHEGRVSYPGRTGFVDVTLISGLHGTQFMCLAPAGHNAHAADECVEIISLIAYRDATIELLSRYKA